MLVLRPSSAAIASSSVSVSTLIAAIMSSVRIRMMSIPTPIPDVPDSLRLLNPLNLLNLLNPLPRPPLPPLRPQRRPQSPLQLDLLLQRGELGLELRPQRALTLPYLALEPLHDARQLRVVRPLQMRRHVPQLLRQRGLHLATPGTPVPHFLVLACQYIHLGGGPFLLLRLREALQRRPLRLRLVRRPRRPRPELRRLFPQPLGLLHALHEVVAQLQVPLHHGPNLGQHHVGHDAGVRVAGGVHGDEPANATGHTVVLAAELAEVARRALGGRRALEGGDRVRHCDQGTAMYFELVTGGS